MTDGTSLRLLLNLAVFAVTSAPLSVHAQSPRIIRVNSCNSWLNKTFVFSESSSLLFGEKGPFVFALMQKEPKKSRSFQGNFYHAMACQNHDKAFTEPMKAA
jgi:hypothetical protein